MDRNDMIIAHYNTAGHPLEWTLHFPGYGPDNYLSGLHEAELRRHLPANWRVCNRGSRLEINSSDFTGDGDEFTATVSAAAVAAHRYATGEDREVLAELVPYRAPEPVLHECKCQCGQRLTMREVMAHLREQKATATA